MRSVQGNYVRIFDTTLRDGEQSPGATLSSTEKLEIARGLAQLGVDVIEAGFPAASPDDLVAVRRVAQEVGNSPGPRGSPPIICGLARATPPDIDAAWEAVRHARHPRIHTFLATSEIHMKHKLRLTPEEVLKRAVEMVRYAKQLCNDIEFSPEDAARSDPDFLCILLAEVVRAGASTLNIPDTVGYSTPDEFGALIATILQRLPTSEDIVLSVHCHDDLGLATANSLAGIRAGARQVEVTVNGIGERAGNASLEEVVMALHTRRPLFGLETGIDTTQITRLSRLVSHYTGIVVPPNKPVVGANAFAHEAGIHQDGVLKHQATYEIMRPEMVGLTQSRLVLGKHSGRHAFSARLSDLGFKLSETELDQAFARFKVLADKKKEVTDADLEVLITDELYQPQAVFALDGLQVTCGTMGLPTATVRLVGPDGQRHVSASIGTGPVDAAYKAIDRIVSAPNRLLEFSIRAVTEGIDAQGEVTVRIQPSDSPTSKHAQREEDLSRTYSGYGADTDIVVASAKAYLAALNKMLTFERRPEAVQTESAPPAVARTG